MQPRYMLGVEFKRMDVPLNVKRDEEGAQRLSVSCLSNQMNGGNVF